MPPERGSSMVDGKFKAAVARARSGGFSIAESRTLVKRARTDGAVDVDERTVFEDLLSPSDRDVFEAGARSLLEKAIEGAPNPRDSLPGKAQGKAVWDGLSDSVDKAQLLPSERLSLARAAAQKGIVGLWQATEVPSGLNALDPVDRDKFRQLLRRCGSDAEAAFLLKALMARHSAASPQPCPRSRAGAASVGVLPTGLRTGYLPTQCC